MKNNANDRILQYLIIIYFTVVKYIWTEKYELSSRRENKTGRTIIGNASENLGWKTMQI